MKAAIFEDLEKLVIKEVPVPEVDDDSALVRVHACAICGSDLRIYHTGNDRVKPPQILGHEISGEVVKTGKNVTKVKVGDRVAIGADVPCGECFFCENGMGNICQNNYAIGYQFAGGFAEYILLNRMTMLYGPVHIIPEDADYSQYTLAEPLGCILNALERTPVKMGDTVAIIGCGPIGCMMIPVVKTMGAVRVIVVERNPDRQRVASESGADVIIHPSEQDMVEEVMRVTGGMGADLVLTATPVPAMQERALHMVKNRGEVNFFGGLPAKDSMVALDTNLVHYKELLVSGAHGSRPCHHRKAVEYIRDGLIDVRPFITHHFPLEQIQEGFDTAGSRQCMRVVIHP